MVVVNGCAFLFQVMVARTLDPSGFGAVASLLAVLLVFEVPASALQVHVARRVQASDGSSDPTAPGFGGLLGETVLGGVLVCAVLAAASPLVAAFLHLHGPGGVLLVALDVVPLAISVVPRGVLVGQGRLRLLAAALASGALTKLALGTLLVHAGLGSRGALAAIVAGEMVSAAILLVRTGAWRAPASDGRDALRWLDAGGPAVAFTGYWLLASLDVILARHFLSGPASGEYAAGAAAAQIGMIVPGALAAVAFPRLVRGEARRARLTLARGVGLVTLLGLVAAGGVALAAHGYVAVLFGGGYPGAAAVVILLALAGTLGGVVSILVHFHTARGVRLPASLSWLGIAVLVVGVALRHGSGADIAAVTLLALGVTTVAMLVVTLGHARVPDEVAEASRRALRAAELDLTVVVPYYNPGDLLAPNLRRLLDVLARSDATFEVIAVSDGSSDGSEASIAAIDDPHLVRLSLPRNLGKGAALRIGMAQGRGRWLGFIDADGDLDPALLEPFQALVRLYDPEVILGSKRHPLSEIDYPLLRRVYSVGFQALTRVLFGLNLRDTQTGIKIIRRDVLDAVLPRMVEKRFAFDLEMFVIARRLGYRRFLEAPVRLHHQFTSTVSARSVVRTFQDVLAILFRLRVLHWYDDPVDPAAREAAVRLDPVVLRASTRAAPAARPSLAAPPPGGPALSPPLGATRQASSLGGP